MSSLVFKRPHNCCLRTSNLPHRLESCIVCTDRLKGFGSRGSCKLVLRPRLVFGRYCVRILVGVGLQAELSAIILCLSWQVPRHHLGQRPPASKIVFIVILLFNVIFLYYAPLCVETVLLNKRKNSHSYNVFIVLIICTYLHEILRKVNYFICRQALLWIIRHFFYLVRLQRNPLLCNV